MTQIVTLLFGTSPKTSILGLLAGLAIAGAAYAQARTEPGWYVVAFALTALGRLAKDAQATGGTTPVTPEAAARVAK